MSSVEKVCSAAGPSAASWRALMLATCEAVSASAWPVSRPAICISVMPITRPMNQVSKPWKFCSAIWRLAAYSTSCAQVSPGRAACRVLPSDRRATIAIFWPRAGSFISAGESSNTTFSASSSAA